MTRSGLAHLYAYCGLPFSVDEGEISALKKALILELKSNSGGILHVNGKEWSKNDILKFFDSPLEAGFDLEAFLAAYPWMKELYEPEKVKYRESLKQVDFSTEEFRAFRKSEAPALEERFERQLRNRLAKQEDHHALALLLYRRAFDPEFAELSERTARKMLLERVRVAIAQLETATDKKASAPLADFMRYTHFYDLIGEIAADDSELLEHIAELYSLVLSTLSVTMAYSVMKNLRRFTYHGTTEAYLDDIEQQLKQLREKQDKSDKGTDSFRYVYIVLVSIIILFRVFMTVNRTNSDVTNYKLIESIRQQGKMQRQLDSMRRLSDTTNVAPAPVDSIPQVQEMDTAY